jgi:diacylglycerol kinase family enzyme
MYYFIINPHASNGKGLKIWAKVQKYLNKTANAQSYEVFMTEKSGDARRFSRKLTENSTDHKIITVIGGEGTLNEVVDGSCLDQDNISIAYLPTRLDDGLARCFRRKLHFKDQLRNLFHEHEDRVLDYGVLSASGVSRRFVASSGIGFDAAVFQDLYGEKCECVRRKKKIHIGRMTYLKTFLKELQKAKKTRGYIDMDDEVRHEFNNILFISAHVHPYEGGYKLGPNADGADGYLDLCIVSTKYKWRVLWIMMLSLVGRHSRMTGVHTYRCREAVIHTERPLPVHVDGENITLMSDVTLRCVPRKLKVRI